MIKEIVNYIFGRTALDEPKAEQEQKKYSTYINSVTPGDKLSVLSHCSGNALALSERDDVSSIFVNVVPGNYASTYSRQLVIVPREIPEDKKELIKELCESKYILQERLYEIMYEFNNNEKLPKLNWFENPTEATCYSTPFVMR